MRAVANRPRRRSSLAALALAGTTFAGCAAYDHARYEQLVDGTPPIDLGAIPDAIDAFDAADAFVDATDAPVAVDSPPDVLDDRVTDDRPDPRDVLVEAGLDDTSCDDAHAGALFCDGFEDPALGRWGAPRVVTGSAARDTNRPIAGVRRSVRRSPPGAAWRTSARDRSTA